MKFDLIRPCKHCPFRSDIRPFLRRGRAEDIADTLLRDGTFSCHKTVDYRQCDDDDDAEPRATGDTQHCAGALIILERLEQPNQMMWIAERLGLYDRTKLDMDAPVYDDFDEWIAAQL